MFVLVSAVLWYYVSALQGAGRQEALDIATRLDYCRQLYSIMLTGFCCEVDILHPIFMSHKRQHFHKLQNNSKYHSTMFDEYQQHPDPTFCSCAQSGSHMQSTLADTAIGFLVDSLVQVRYYLVRFFSVPITSTSRWRFLHNLPLHPVGERESGKTGCYVVHGWKPSRLCSQLLLVIGLTQSSPGCPVRHICPLSPHSPHTPRSHDHTECRGQHPTQSQEKRTEFGGVGTCLESSSPKPEQYNQMILT